jgi:uncharacterized membrane protein (UPF0182 family)
LEWAEFDRYAFACCRKLQALSKQSPLPAPVPKKRHGIARVHRLAKKIRTRAAAQAHLPHTLCPFCGDLLFCRTAVTIWVDLLWFRSLGYEGVFWKTLGLEWGAFGGFALVTFVILYGTFLALRHAHAGDLPSNHTIYVAGNAVNLPVGPAMHVIATALSLLIALGTGAAMKAQWPTLALFWYAPHSQGTIADPIFGLPLNFYLFALPAWQLIAGWLLTLALLACVLAIVFLFISGSSRALAGRFGSGTRCPGADFPSPSHLCWLCLLFALILAALRCSLSGTPSLMESLTRTPM